LKRSFETAADCPIASRPRNRWRQEFAALRRQRLSADHPLGTLPLRVLERAKDSTKVWHNQQVELARLSSAGKLITAEGSGHLIHLERPDLVAQAIGEVILRDLRPGPHPATSEGQSIEEARASLVEALSLFFETADPSEVVRRFHDEIFIAQIEVPVG
jgi:hypothetical protein